MLSADSVKCLGERDNQEEREGKRKMPNFIQRRTGLRATVSEKTQDICQSAGSIRYLQMKTRMTSLMESCQ